jgi:multiple sugar transport system permease protein
MIYPFWLMITGTTKSGVDSAAANPIPLYLRNNTALYQKTVEALFNESAPTARQVYNRNVVEFRTMEPPAEVNAGFVNAWEQFLNEKEYPFFYFQLGYSSVVASRGSTPANLRRFKGQMYKKYSGDLSAMNAAEGTEFVAWPNFLISETSFIYRRTLPNISVPFLVSWYKFKDASKQSERAYTTATGYYKYNFLLTQYSDKIENYNESHNTTYQSYDEVFLDRHFPARKSEAEQRDWDFFVRNVLNLFWVRVDASALPAFHDYLKTKYQQIDNLNKVYGSKYREFNEIPLVERLPYSGVILADWGSFVQGWVDPTTETLHKVPAEALSVSSIEFEFQDYLREKYKTVAAVNEALGTDFKELRDIYPPQYEYQYRSIMAEKAKWRFEFTIRNFLTVSDYILFHGRALMNTAIYCILAVLSALIVNPLAAYALSRFRPPSAYKVLLFLMLTMAFPQMVTQIPNFLMLRELGLLNTFGALVLPGLANGYQIFLLKGFFDSLPKELYESAMLDGASEPRIFLQLTMNLSKPILAVIALQAFTSAYSNFMMALLICQDRAMWTIMPWLYQLQMSSCQGIIYASLIIASIPTFLVFMLCQNVIMRGIVVPVEK